MLNSAAEALHAGHLVAFPTETVYGLGADALNVFSVSRLYQIKQRPLNHPVIIHVSDFSKIYFWADRLPDYLDNLVARFIPGPITLILNKSESLQITNITGNQEKVAIRIPKHSVATSVLSKFEKLGGRGVVAPSANKFGKVSATNGLDIEKELGLDLGKHDLILNDGDCEIGIESTILDCTSKIPRILRPGYITKEEIDECLGFEVNFSEDFYNKRNLKYSGMFSKHYSPKAKVIFEGIPSFNDGYIGLSNQVVPHGVKVLALPKKSEEFAQLLYKTFRRADSLGFERIFVSLPKFGKLASAIRDRVLRAAG